MPNNDCMTPLSHNTYEKAYESEKSPSPGESLEKSRINCRANNKECSPPVPPPRSQSVSVVPCASNSSTSEKKSATQRSQKNGYYGDSDERLRKAVKQNAIAQASAKSGQQRSSSPTDDLSNSYDVADDAERSFLRPTPQSNNQRRQVIVHQNNSSSSSSAPSVDGGGASLTKKSSGSGGAGSIHLDLPEYSQPPRSPRFSLSVEEENELDNAIWYQPDCSRDVALDYLSKQVIGGFVVRDSGTHPNCYALSVKVEADPQTRHSQEYTIAHYLIQRTSRGVRLKGLDKHWPTLACLIVHLTVMPEMLPCPLKMPTSSGRNSAMLNDTPSPATHQQISPAVAVRHSNNNFRPISSQSHENCGILPIPLDKDYQCLSDFSSIMADLQLRPSAANRQQRKSRIV